MIATQQFRIARDLLQELANVTERFVKSQEPLIEFLGHDEYFCKELMGLFDSYDVTEGRFTFFDFIPNGCVRGTELRFVHVREAGDAVREAIDVLRRCKGSSLLLDEETFEQILIDHLQESLRAPFVAKDIIQMRRDLLCVFLPSASKKYPALSKHISYTDKEFQLIVDQVIRDLECEAAIPDSKISKVTEFIRELHRCASERLWKLPDAQQKSLFT